MVIFNDAYVINITYSKNMMAQFRLRGNKAIIVQTFSRLPEFVIMEFASRPHGEHCNKEWQKRILKNNGIRI